MLSGSILLKIMDLFLNNYIIISFCSKSLIRKVLVNEINKLEFKK